MSIDSTELRDSKEQVLESFPIFDLFLDLFLWFVQTGNNSNWFMHEFMLALLAMLGLRFLMGFGQSSSSSSLSSFLTCLRLLGCRLLIMRVGGATSSSSSSSSRLSDGTGLPRWLPLCPLCPLCCRLDWEPSSTGESSGVSCVPGSFILGAFSRGATGWPSSFGGFRDSLHESADESSPSRKVSDFDFLVWYKVPLFLFSIRPAFRLTSPSRSPSEPNVVSPSMANLPRISLFTFCLSAASSMHLEISISALSWVSTRAF
mmetsp:Transcript_30765/g.84850  ORF Transcript_30765/g.84850 Transcript_30765/m.84850 type:complete len:260 (-) Transcript_30765:140-919(-)